MIVKKNFVGTRLGRQSNSVKRTTIMMYNLEKQLDKNNSCNIPQIISEDTDVKETVDTRHEYRDVVPKKCYKKGERKRSTKIKIKDENNGQLVLEEGDLGFLDTSLSASKTDASFANESDYQLSLSTSEIFANFDCNVSERDTSKNYSVDQEPNSFEGNLTKNLAAISKIKEMTNSEPSDASHLKYELSNSCRGINTCEANQKHKERFTSQLYEYHYNESKMSGNFQTVDKEAWQRQDYQNEFFLIHDQMSTQLTTVSQPQLQQYHGICRSNIEPVSPLGFNLSNHHLNWEYNHTHSQDVSHDMTLLQPANMSQFSVLLNNNMNWYSCENTSMLCNNGTEKTPCCKSSDNTRTSLTDGMPLTSMPIYSTGNVTKHCKPMTSNSQLAEPVLLKTTKGRQEAASLAFSMEKVDFGFKAQSHRIDNILTQSQQQMAGTENANLNISVLENLNKMSQIAEPVTKLNVESVFCHTTQVVSKVSESTSYSISSKMKPQEEQMNTSQKVFFKNKIIQNSNIAAEPKDVKSDIPQNFEENSTDFLIGLSPASEISSFEIDKSLSKKSTHSALNEKVVSSSVVSPGGVSQGYSSYDDKSDVGSPYADELHKVVLNLPEFSNICSLRERVARAWHLLDNIIVRVSDIW